MKGTNTTIISHYCNLDHYFTSKLVCHEDASSVDIADNEAMTLVVQFRHRLDGHIAAMRQGASVLHFLRDKRLVRA